MTALHHSGQSPDLGGFESSPGFGPLHQFHLWLSGRIRLLAGWRTMRQDRLAYRRMLDVDDHLLIDMGVTRHELHQLIRDPRRDVLSRHSVFIRQPPV